MTVPSVKTNHEKFRVLKRDLVKGLKHMCKLELFAGWNHSTLEVTLVDNFIILNIPGLNLKVPAQISGAARFTMPLKYFQAIVRDQKDNTMEFHLTDDCLSIRSNLIFVQTTFFLDDRILRSIQLPVNYTQADLARLLLTHHYTEEEIAFNNLEYWAAEALRSAREDIKKVAQILKPYGLDQKFVREMILGGMKDQ